MAIVVRDSREEDLAAILAIHNDAVLNTTAIWSYDPVDLDDRRAFISERKAKGFPFLVADDEGAVAGYASFGDFRPWAGYLRTVEHLVYVEAKRRGQGVGRMLMEPLIEQARAMGKHAMIGGIEAGNEPSLRLHAKLGFFEAGRLPEVGQKFGRWLDLVFMQKMLD